MSTPTITPTLPAPPTWSAYETLPDGREHLLAEHLRYTQMLAQGRDRTMTDRHAGYIVTLSQ
jgi:hypothetical protein